MKNVLASVLCIAGGVLLFIASWQGDIGLLSTVIAYVQTMFPSLAGILEIVLRVLLWIAGLGGTAVVLGGLLILISRIRLGKLLVGLGAGVGLIGLILIIVTAVSVGGLDQLLSLVALMSYSLGWIGVILTVVGRMFAKSNESP
ncbi:MAG: hypothetical protein QXS20_10355 [Candidatus Thorarchaeota archaeon]